jgi:hypothetical protein
MNDSDKIQSQGRHANAAQPLNASKNDGGAERYPKVRKDDGVASEGRAFKGPANPQPRQGAGDSSPTQDRTGADEGKR